MVQGSETGSETGGETGVRQGARQGARQEVRQKVRQGQDRRWDREWDWGWDREWDRERDEPPGETFTTWYFSSWSEATSLFFLYFNDRFCGCVLVMQQLNETWWSHSNLIDLETWADSLHQFSPQFMQEWTMSTGGIKSWDSLIKEVKKILWGLRKGLFWRERNGNVRKT